MVVENVILGSIAESKGLHEGDEVMLINDKSPAELEWSEIEHLTNTGIYAVNYHCLTTEYAMSCAHLYIASKLTITVRSKSPSPVHSPSPHILDSLICPAPPTHQTELTGEHLSRLTVPGPGCKSE